MNKHFIHLISLVLCLAFALLLPASQALGETPQTFAAGISSGGSGLFIGAPSTDVNGEINAGSVSILFSNNTGLVGEGSLYWDQSLLPYNPPGEGDGLGWALAAGHFNGDASPDLVIGIPRESIGGDDGAGAVQILYGVPGGFAESGGLWLNQDSPGIAGASEPDDNFGKSLTVGDFNGDGFDDIAVGVPNEDLGSVENAGGVNIFYGSQDGITSAGNAFWSQKSTGVYGTAEEGDIFAYALASADFNHDGYDDLAIGVPYEDVVVSSENLNAAGAINILYGSANGIGAGGNQLIIQSDLTQDSSEAGDIFGNSLAAGDFDADGYADLAVGVRYEDISSVLNAGAAHIIYGGVGGLQTNRDQIWNQDSTSIYGSCESNDEFGYALTAGDFDGDGYADLAIGVPSEDIHSNSIEDAGIVQIIYGSSDGLHWSGNQLWSQDSDMILDSAEENDNLGGALAAGDFNFDGYQDLAIGVISEDIYKDYTIQGAGAVQVIYGSNEGLTAEGNQFLSRESPGVAGDAQEHEVFSFALAAIPLGNRVYLPLVKR